MKKSIALGVIVISILAMIVAGEAIAKEWETDFAIASNRAKVAGKYMLLDFTGSDWCGWCVRLNKEVFKKYEFKRFARQNLVCVKLDFPQKARQSRKLKDQNAKLKSKYGISGFPTIIVLTPDGKVVGRTGYLKGGAGNYVNHLKELIGIK
jgi:thioredoxin-related protein